MQGWLRQDCNRGKVKTGGKITLGLAGGGRNVLKYLWFLTFEKKNAMLPNEDCLVI